MPLSKRREKGGKPVRRQAGTTYPTPPPMLPTRGVPGGCRDWWDSPDEALMLWDQTEDAHRRPLSAQGRLPARGPCSA